MANMSYTRMLFSPFALFIVVCFSNVVNSIEFQVGGDKHWTIPNVRQQDRDFYNEWASKHRFKVNDTVRFKYEKDSVQVVTEEEYHKCKSSHPIFFSNNEDTLFTLDRSGLFYFISGISGHCERGQKMIIKVLEEKKQKQEEEEAGRTAVTPSSSSSVVPEANQNNHTNGGGGGGSGSTAVAPSSAAVSESSCERVGVVLVGAMVIVSLLG